jgi:predicted transcriptional regulator of viral defense system
MVYIPYHMGATRLQIARKDIVKFFDDAGHRVYSQKEIATIFSANRAHWRLPLNLTMRGFVEFLIEKTHFKVKKLASERYGRLLRYAWRDVSSFQVGLSIGKGAYLSHGTAVYLHGLTDQNPKTVYVNREQSPKPRSRSMTQEAINRSFSGRQRKSNYIFFSDGWRFVLISGKHTGNLGVEKTKDPTGAIIDATNIARTLIDITVRPEYAGGVYQVLAAYKAAKERVAANDLLAILKELDHAYPYHQAIGCYMQKAGYDEAAYSIFATLGFKYDFYLANGISNPQFDPAWRLYCPQGF